ncbi:MAG: hypothetical protein KAW51_08060 [Candidatus Lokiarchaeota archaeon]|nr:hypothetical protein [Candidatus Lokiarchaeota archaeon]
MKLEDIQALDTIINLVEEFVEKNIIRKKKANFNKIREKFNNLKDIKEEEKQVKLYQNILSKLFSIIKRDVLPDTYFIIGGHGGIIINDIGFCEFDSPKLAMEDLLKKMQLAIETNMPYNIEIAISCLEWLDKNSPDKIKEFLRIFKQGRFEIINPSYSQPYNLIIGPESNIKQFEYGLNVLHRLELSSNIFYCSESSLHPQIPQILKGFNIKYGSLRTRILGVNPTSNSAYINWTGLDNTTIETIVDQSGVFNGEYWHGTFFKEIPNLLFQSVARPFMEYIIYSNLEDFRNRQPLQEEIWRISKFSEIFGNFLQCSEFFEIIEKNGEFKYKRDEFLLGNFIFILSELFLQNKNSEIILISAEIINCILGIFSMKSNDNLLEDLWKKLLLTQTHDCYAVPFIRPGDYTQAQLGKEELKKLELKLPNISISDLGIQIHKDIQDKCQDFINISLSQLVKELGQEKNDSKNLSNRIFVFNPTCYTRNDVITINSQQEPEFKIIEDIPGFGYKIVSYSEENKTETQKNSVFLYNIEILEDLKTIQVKFKKKEVFELKFNSKRDYKLYLEEQYQDNVVQWLVIEGKLKDQAFKIKLVQFRGINRLELYINSILLQEIILNPLIEIKKSIINYPFGIEETKRSKIQTLDFMWLKGSEQGIIYIQKNSQIFKINRENFEIRNLLLKKGRFEFAISITDENNSLSPLYYVDSFYYKLLVIKIDDKLEIKKNIDTFLSIDLPISVINMWKREDGSFLRLFNPSNKERTIKLSGKLVKNQVKEIDFNYNVLSTLESNNINFRPWKIKTLKF